MVELFTKFSQLSTEWSLSSVALRLISALLIGVMIGIDRETKRRGAGIKTHTLVCLGAALVMLTGQYIYMNFDGKNDIARLGAQVISGVGFLGVGTIIVTGRNQVRGLTTAAGLWACACMGLAVGIGFLSGAFITVILVLITLKILTKIDYYMHQNSKVFDLYIEFESNKVMSKLVDTLRSQNIKINSFEIGKSKVKGEGPNAVLCVEVEEKSKRALFIDEIRMLEGIRYVEEL